MLCAAPPLATPGFLHEHRVATGPLPLYLFMAWGGMVYHKQVTTALHTQSNVRSPQTSVGADSTHTHVGMAARRQWQSPAKLHWTFGARASVRCSARLDFKPRQSKPNFATPLTALRIFGTIPSRPKPSREHTLCGACMCVWTQTEARAVKDNLPAYW